MLSANRLAQVPPVLGGACALEVLDLSSNPCLELSRHDVDATLSRMPRLSLLLLGKQAALGLPGMSSTMYGVPEWRTPSVAALVALGQALPQLQACGGRAAPARGGTGPICASCGGLGSVYICRLTWARPSALPRPQIDFEHTAAEYEGI